MLWDDREMLQQVWMAENPHHFATRRSSDVTHACQTA